MTGWLIGALIWIAISILLGLLVGKCIALAEKRKGYVTSHPDQSEYRTDEEAVS